MSREVDPSRICQIPVNSTSDLRRSTSSYLLLHVHVVLGTINKKIKIENSKKTENLPTVHLLKTGDGCSLEMEERCLDHAATPSTWAQFSNILPCLGCPRKLESGRRPDQIGAQDVPPFCQLSISSSVALELLCAVET